MQQTNGYSLLEIIITLFLCSVSFLALFTSQAHSLYYQNEAMQYMSAYRLADDLFERIQANLDAETETVYTQLSQPLTITADCTIQPCTKLELASYDVWQWQSLMHSAHFVAFIACLKVQNQLLILALHWSNRRVDKTCTDDWTAFALYQQRVILR